MQHSHNETDYYRVQSSYLTEYSMIVLTACMVYVAHLSLLNVVSIISFTIISFMIYEQLFYCNAFMLLNYVNFPIIVLKHYTII